MKIKQLLIVLLSFITSLVFAQKSVKLQTLEAKKGTVFYLENMSNFTQKATLIITSGHFENGYKIKVKKIKPKQKRKFYKLKHKKPVKFTAKVEFEKKATKKELQKEAEKIIERQFDLATDDIDKGIIIFSKKACSRCRLAEKILDENNIKFKRIAIDESPEGKKLMWKKVRGNSTKKMRIKTPVIIIDGKASYSHKDLIQFVKDIE